MAMEAGKFFSNLEGSLPVYHHDYRLKAVIIILFIFFTISFRHACVVFSAWNIGVVPDKSFFFSKLLPSFFKGVPSSSMLSKAPSNGCMSRRHITFMTLHQDLLFFCLRYILNQNFHQSTSSKIKCSENIVALFICTELMLLHQPFLQMLPEQCLPGRGQWNEIRVSQ